MGKYKVDIPFVDTNNIKVLKNDEMLELFKKYNDGDMLAKEELINGNLKLVLSIIKKYSRIRELEDEFTRSGVYNALRGIIPTYKKYI